MKPIATRRDIQRYSRCESYLARTVRAMTDYHDASDAELHAMLDRAIDVIRHYPIPSWRGWETDPRAQELIAARDAHRAGAERG